jgi:hypothetical protein
MITRADQGRFVIGLRSALWRARQSTRRKDGIGSTPGSTRSAPTSCGVLKVKLSGVKPRELIFRIRCTAGMAELACPRARSGRVQRDVREARRATAGPGGRRRLSRRERQLTFGGHDQRGRVGEQAKLVLITTDDRMIPPQAQREMSGRAGSTVEEAAASHSVYVSQPAAWLNSLETLLRSEVGCGLSPSFRRPPCVQSTASRPSGIPSGAKRLE